MTFKESILFFPGLITTLGLLAFVVYALHSVHVKGKENARLKKAGTQTSGVITGVHSNKGENSAVINITLQVRYYNAAMKQDVEGTGRVSVDVTTITAYQPGNTINIIYNNERPEAIFPVVPDIFAQMRRGRP